MFARDVDYPKAVASDDDEGVAAAFTWCFERMKEGDVLTVWTHLKSSLAHWPKVEQLVSQYSDVEHVASRGGGSIRSRGPVLMLAAGMDDIGELMHFAGRRIRALCVIPWDEDALRPWAAAVRPIILGDDPGWKDLTVELDPVVIEAMKGVTRSVNHNNTISAGREKDVVVSTLLALHDAGFRMDGEAVQGWALANGWSGENPARLAKYVNDIDAGKRPRSQRVLRAEYIADLRRRVATAEQHR